MMKKAAVMFLLLLAVCVCIPHGMAADVSVRLNGEELHCRGVQPFLSDGVVFVPARALMETMGGQVEWNAAEQRVLLIREEQKLNLQIGNTEATDMWHGSREKITLPVAPRLIDGCTMVPLRAVAEVFYADVVWDAAHQTVHIIIARNVPATLGNQEVADIIRTMFHIPDGEPILETHLARISHITVYQNWISFDGRYEGYIETYNGLEKLVWIRSANITLTDGWDPGEILRLPHIFSLCIEEKRSIANRKKDYMSEFKWNGKIESLHLKYIDTVDLRGMPSLRKLTLENCKERDLSKIPFEQLRSLDIYNWSRDFLGIYNLCELKKAQKLVTIRFRGMDIRDISVLKELPLLDTLTIQCCGIRDVSALGKLPNLRSVDLSDNLISDIAPLFACKTLRRVQADYNSISGDLEICDMPKLQDVSFNHNELTTLTIKSTPELKYVAVEHNKLRTEPTVPKLPESCGEALSYGANPFLIRTWLSEKEHAQIIRAILQDYVTNEELRDDTKEAIYGNTIYIKNNTVNPEWIPEKVGAFRLCVLSNDEIWKKRLELGEFFVFDISYPEQQNNTTISVEICCDQIGAKRERDNMTLGRDRKGSYFLGKNEKDEWEVLGIPNFMI